MTESFADVDVDHPSAPALHDVDADGDLDLIVGSQMNGVQWAENTGTPEAYAFGALRPMPLDAPEFATPTVTDWNGDARADFVMGSRGGGLLLFRGQGGQ